MPEGPAAAWTCRPAPWEWPCGRRPGSLSASWPGGLLGPGQGTWKGSGVKGAVAHSALGEGRRHGLVCNLVSQPGLPQRLLIKPGLHMAPRRAARRKVSPGHRTPKVSPGSLTFCSGFRVPKEPSQEGRRHPCSSLDEGMGPASPASSRPDPTLSAPFPLAKGPPLGTSRAGASTGPPTAARRAGGPGSPSLWATAQDRWTNL